MPLTAHQKRIIEATRNKDEDEQKAIADAVESLAAIGRR
jgi:hypothetical protein